MQFVMPDPCRQAHPVINGLHCLLGLKHQGPHKGMYYDMVNWNDDDDFGLDDD